MWVHLVILLHYKPLERILMQTITKTKKRLPLKETFWIEQDQITHVLSSGDQKVVKNYMPQLE